MRILPFLFALAALLGPVAAWADAGEVRFAQGDVHILRAGGKAESAVRGTRLHEGDTIVTGAGGYAQLTMVDDAIVAVRPDTRLKVEIYRYSGKADSSEKGVWGLVRGGFRTLTGWIGRNNKDAYAVRTPTATIGIRGTDVWGKTDKDGDLVALLEGKIEITRAGQATEMSQAMTYYDAPRGRGAEVKSLDPESFARLARQTDIVAGDGAAGSKGKWTLLAGSAASQEAALEIYDQAQDAGFAARIRPRAVEDGGWRYEVAVGRYASAAEAEVAAARLKAATELKPTVVR